MENIDIDIDMVILENDALSPALFLAKFECEIFLLMGKIKIDVDYIQRL